MAEVLWIFKNDIKDESFGVSLFLVTLDNNQTNSNTLDFTKWLGMAASDGKQENQDSEVEKQLTIS